MFLLLLLPLALKAQKVKKMEFTDAAALYDESTGMMEKENYEEAITTLLKISRSDTLYTEVLRRLAIAYIGKEDYKSAVNVSLEALRFPCAFKRDMYELVIVAYNALKMKDSALYYVDEGFKNFPEFHKFYYHKGMIYKDNKEYKKALQSFEMAAWINPFYSNTHLQIGVIAMNSDQFVQAMLAFQTFLVFEENTSRSLSVLSTCEEIAKGSLVIHPDSIWIKGEHESNFQEMETILRSKIAIDKSYKTEVKLDYPTVIKQIQVIVEKMQFVAADSNFFMQYYVPVYNMMWKKDIFPGYIYHIFSAIEDKSAQSEIRKHKNDVEKFVKEIGTYMADLRSKTWKDRKLVDKGMSPWFLGSGALSAIGEYDEANDIHKGYWKYYDDDGNRKSEGNYNGNKYEGKWIFYYPEGGIRGYETYKNGELNDSSVYYYPNGNLKSKAFYRDGKAQGEASLYFYSGGVSAKFSLKDDKYNGTNIYYHPTGGKKEESNYVDGKLTGTYLTWHENGNKNEIAAYVNEKLEGKAESYFQSGNKKSEGIYKEGEAEGNWKIYNSYGRLDSEGNYSKGKRTGEWKSYYADGKLKEKAQYVNGVINGKDIYYDTDSVLWSEIEWSKDNLKSYKYFDKAGKIISQGNVKVDVLSVKAYFPEGMVLTEGDFKNGVRSGAWTEYSRCGKIKEKGNYDNGILDGKQYYYRLDGSLESEISYEDGNRDGYYARYFSDGTLAEQGYYCNDKLCGEWLKYYVDGSLEERNFFVDGEIHGYSDNYSPEGKRYLEYLYYYGEFLGFNEFDTTGRMYNSQLLTKGSGTLKTLTPDGKKTLSEVTYKNGRLDATFSETFANGKIRRKISYKAGMKNGPYKFYSLENTAYDEGTYLDNERDSISINSQQGKKFCVSNYDRAELTGERTWYYPDGKVDRKGTYLHDERDGYYYYYAQEGTVQVRLFYRDAHLISYAYLTAPGKYCDEILINNTSGTIKAFYPGGATSLELTVNCGLYEGVFKRYNPDGKLASEETYNKYDNNGASKYYYPSGLLRRELNFVNDEISGQLKLYNEKGVLTNSYSYVNGSLSGPQLYYDETGKLIKTIKCINNVPVE